MGAAWKNRSVLVIDSGAGRSVPWPHGHHAGDYALLVAAKADTASIAETLSTPAGFTLVGSVEQNVGGVLSRLTVWYNVATSGSMTTPVVSADHLGSSSTAVMFTFSGCANAAPDASQTTPTSGNSLSIAGVNTTQANDFVVNVSCQFTTSGSNSASGWTNANIANLLEYFDQSAQLVGLGNQGLGLAMAGGCARAIGATGATAATWAGTGGFLGSGSMQIALKSAATTAVSKDATSGKYTPATEAEWCSIFHGDGLATPATLLNCQDAGPAAPVDALGFDTYSLSGSPTFGNAVTGWARKAIICRQAQSDLINTGAWTDYASFALAWLNFPTVNVDGNPSSIITFGTTFGHQVAIDMVALNTKLAAVYHNDTALNSAVSTQGVHLTMLQADHDSDTVIVQTDLETLSHNPANAALDVWGSFALGGNNANYWQGSGVGYMQVAGFASFAPTSTIRSIIADRLNNGPSVASIAVTPTPVTLASIGATQQLTAIATRQDGSTVDITATATWLSSDPTKATVSSTGLVTAIATGTANITCTYASFQAPTRTSNASVVTVSSGVTFVGISVTPAVGQCFIGGTKQFTAIGTKSDTTTQDVTSTAVWSSSNPAAATVAAGLASGLSIGGTIITATINGHSDTSMLTVLVNAGAAGDLADQQAAMFGEDIWYDVSHPDDQGFADLIVDAGGDWQDVTGIEALRQSLLRRMITSPGEWQTVPEYGVGARQYIKAPMTPSTIAELESRIRSQYLRDDRVESIDSITITPLTGNLPGIYVLVNVIPKGRLRQDVTLPVAITIT